MASTSTSLFVEVFKALTGHLPFPWQEKLFDRFVQGDIPSSCNLPTGLGKTSVIAVWLIALARTKGKLPRRLVYVVNRRTVVDQATDEAKKLRDNLDKAGLTRPLQELCAFDHDIPLGISTLRGQFADNGEWAADPARPVILVGTVDMIGSRLLFSGYGIGFKRKPLHAGFLGQDTLLVHDEAHLEPAFQRLLTTIEDEQRRCRDFARLMVMQLSATSRTAGDVFQLTEKEKSGEVPIVRDRLFAKKGLALVSTERTKVASKIGELALRHREPNKAVLVFVRTIDDVDAVRSTLTSKKGRIEDQSVQVLTGTLRGLERDHLANDDPVFARFLPEPKVQPMSGTVYLICTSAGEVGVDISADHMVCDLSTLDSMAQRLGRVNRRGGGRAEIDVVYETDPDPKKQDNHLEQARWGTLNHVRRLPACDWISDRLEASPHELGELIRQLPEEQQKAAFAPEPIMLPATDILFDAWALTTIRDKMPGRPPVEPYLHGIREWEPPETYVAWREEVGVIIDDLRGQYEPRDLLDDYPIKPHELLRDRSDRVFKHLITLAQRCPDDPAWLLDDYGDIETLSLRELVDKDKKNRINHRTVLLSPDVGGLQDGLLSGESLDAQDVADEWHEDAEKTIRRRIRVWDDDPQREEKTAGMRLIREIRFDTDEENEDAVTPSWLWFERPDAADNEGSKSALKPVPWQDHTDKVEGNAAAIVEKLLLPDDVKKAVVLAAKFHDLGKKREVWQRSIGNPNPRDWYAKSGKGWKSREISRYRHEFGSLLDIPEMSEFREESDDVKNLVLHLVAAGHGRGRPHFPANEAFDPETKGRDVNEAAIEVVRRFARLQSKYGRWGLAYLESLLRAADYAASIDPSIREDKQREDLS